MTETFWLYETAEENNARLTRYVPEKKESNWTFLIFPGGGYDHLAVHEGKGYAEFLNANGIQAFVLEYRFFPHLFPAPLADARNAMRFMRKNAEKYGIDPDKIAVIGSSAGGNLAAMLCNYYELIDGETEADVASYLPNAQALCYPVIRTTPDFGHVGSGKNLFGDKYDEMAEKFSFDTMVNEKTPPAFLWHTMADPGVPVLNTLAYTEALYKQGIRVEVHLFPDGGHGYGLATRSNDDVSKHIAQWSGLMLNWLKTFQ